MSLNAFAKAFVPGGGGSVAAPAAPGAVPITAPPAPPTEPPFYRYSLMAPPTRVVEIENSSTLSNLSLMFSKRLIAPASKGGTGVAALSKFVEDFYAHPSNAPSPVPGAPTGFFVSRELLSLSAPDAIVDVSERDGFLIPLDVSPMRGIDVGGEVLNSWQSLFAAFQNDYRVTVFGYVSVQRGTDPAADTSDLLGTTYYHYLFVACTAKKQQLVVLTAQSIQESVPNCKAVLPVHSVLQYVLCHRTPVALYLSLADGTNTPDKDDSAKGLRPSKSWKLSFHEGSVMKTIDSVREVISGVHLQMNDGSVAGWQKTEMLRVEVHLPCAADASDAIQDSACGSAGSKVAAASGSSSPAFPLFPLDILQLLKQSCDECMVPIVGVIVAQNGGNRRRATFQQVLEFVPTAAQFDSDASFAASLSSRVELEWQGKFLGVFPVNLFAAPIRSAEEYLAVRSLLDVAFVPRQPAQLLTRAVFAAAADKLAKEPHKSRRNVVGREVVVIADPSGQLFAADTGCGALVSLPMCWSHMHAVPHSSVFDAVLTTSLRGDRQYRMVLQDVLMWHGSTECLDMPLQQRWHPVELCGIDDETSWPHGSPFNIVILRTLYTNFPASQQLLQGPNAHVISDAPVLGIRVVPATAPRRALATTAASFEWRQPDTVTALFSVIKTSEIPEAPGAIRVLLGVAGSGIEPYNNEYVDVLQGHGAPAVGPGDVVECMLRRTQDGAHWWEVLRVHQVSGLSWADQMVLAPWTAVRVDSIAHSPAITLEELQWLFTCSTFICMHCSTVSDVGRVDPASKQYYCRPCWEQNGHGDCINCGGTYLLGANDAVSKRFFCENCWTVFTTHRQSPHGAPPPPTNANTMTQVTTRVISLFIDTITPKGPSSDILELCCGAAVVRKWISTNNVTRYLGIDVKNSVVEETNNTIATFKSTGNANFEAVVADAFSPVFWAVHLSRLHRGLFHCITCFAGLHYAFRDEAQARMVLASISNALVPNGLFVGSLIGASSLFRRGRRFRNEFFSAEWDESALPVVGTVYRLAADGSEPKERFVIPLDFLVALAAEVGLQLLPELSMTFDVILERDPKWIRPTSADEKEFLSLWMTVAFRKMAQKVAHQRQEKDKI
jgi:SAM-dependent methyltransferase